MQYKTRNDVNDIKETDTHIKLYSYNEEKGDKIPNNITHIIFETIIEYNANVFSNYLTGSLYTVNNLPDSLIKIQFDNRFNNTVNNLPQKIEILIFGFDFNKEIDKLPEILNYLEFGFRFNNEIKEYPKTLKTLIFGSSYNKTVNNLPCNKFY